MAGDGDLQQRFIAAATVAGVADPRQWVVDNMLTLAADPDVNAAYASALAAYDAATEAVAAAQAAVPDARIGRRDDVVADNNILNAVNANKPSV